MRHRLLPFVLVTASLALASCGESGDEAGAPSLAISIVGLPADVDAGVEVTGPGGVTRSVGVTQTLSDLPAGVYAIAANNVLTGSTIYAPREASRTFTMTAGSRVALTVTYENGGELRLGLQQIAAGLDQPLFLTAPSGDPRLFVAERPGRVRVLKDGVLVPTPVLDISARVSTAGEGGLLSLAFDPQFANNGFLFAHFTDATGDVAVERFHLSATNPDVADPTPLGIITITHRTFGNHKGGRVAFGPDGFLYLSVGDGGGGGDPFGSGQNLNMLLGKLLRIDVANASAGQPNRQPEIWAYGLRNPWRFAFDPPSGLLYVADVGQGAREEANVASAAVGGVNYGWNLTEGSLCFAIDRFRVSRQRHPGIARAVLLQRLLQRLAAQLPLQRGDRRRTGRLEHSRRRFDLLLRPGRAGGAVRAHHVERDLQDRAPVISRAARMPLLSAPATVPASSLSVASPAKKIVSSIGAASSSRAPSPPTSK